MTLADHVPTYAAFKRATGLAFQEQERLLASFARHAEAQGERFVRVETCLDWASQSVSPHRKQRRLHLVCGLAAYLHAEDERHEVPHHDALGRQTYHRPPPRLLSLEQIGQVMDAALVRGHNSKERRDTNTLHVVVRHYVNQRALKRHSGSLQAALTSPSTAVE